MDFNLTIPRAFAKWKHTEKLFKIAVGGRYGGKTQSIPRLLISKSFEFQGGNIVFGRYVDKSNDTAGRDVMLKIIENSGLQFSFKTYSDRIVNKKTQVEFRFLGLMNHTVDNASSYNDIKILWIDEAHQIKQYALDRIRDTIRSYGGHVELWASFNRIRKTDAISKLIHQFEDKFEKIEYKINDKTLTYKEYEDSNILITDINYDGNYFFSEEDEKKRVYALENEPLTYHHKWVGEYGSTEGHCYTAFSLHRERYIYEKYTYETKTLSIGADYGIDMTCFVAVCISETYDFYISEEHTVEKEIDGTVNIKRTTKEWKEFIFVCMKKYKPKYLRLFGDYANAFVISPLNTESLKSFNQKTEKSTKYLKKDRIDFTNTFFDYGKLKICNTCKNTIDEIAESDYNNLGERNDKNDHFINCFEYAVAPFVKIAEKYKERKILGSDETKSM